MVMVKWSEPVGMKVDRTIRHPTLNKSRNDLGGLAQLGERVHGMHKVSGSNPPSIKDFMKEAFQLGYNATTICDNPFWIEYPKPSKKSFEDELNARAFVDGYVQKIKDETKTEN